MKAVIEVQSVTIICPKCDNHVANGPDSFVWHSDEIGNIQRRGNKIDCSNCGAVLDIPKTIKLEC